MQGKGRGRGSIPPTLIDLESEVTATSTRTVYAKPTDADFLETILAKRAISMELLPSQSATAHFGTQALFGPRIPFYKQLQRCSDTAIWLDGGDGFENDVVREYRYMTANGLCEAEFATYAKETLLKRDARSLDDPLNRLWMTERMVELVAKPEGKSTRWNEPPQLDHNIQCKPYRYDIRPDCSYWLSLQAFNPEYKNQVREWVYVMNKRITCPYFTVEFKRDESSIDAAINQVATASALALYNRHQLKQERRAIWGQQWTKDDIDSVRHYGLTFTGDSYTFWCTTPKTDPSNNHSWLGCTMRRVYQSDCSFKQGVKFFVDWVNEIHRWGLTMHGPACEDDVKSCMKKQSHGIRTSLGIEDLCIDQEESADE